jgi:hypothetical protein
MLSLVAAALVVGLLLARQFLAPGSDLTARSGAREAAADGRSARRADPEVPPDSASESAADEVGAHREVALAPGSAAHAELAVETSAATLKLVVSDRGGGGRLAGVVIAPDLSDLPLLAAQTARARNGVAESAPVELTTDAKGAATLHWVAGRRITLACRPGGRAADEQIKEVPPLQVDEERELALELWSGADLEFHGSVVEADASGGATTHPIAGAQVLTHDWKSRKVPVANSNSDGRFHFRASSWKKDCLEVAADGYAPAFARIEPGHESPERARVIKLAKVARLRARVRDASGAAVRGATIDLYLRPGLLTQPEPGPVDAPPLLRRAETDEEGRATVDDVPPGVALDVEIRATGCATFREGGAFTLEAGTTGEREFTLGTLARVHGRVVDRAGDPVEGAKLSLTSRDNVKSAPGGFQFGRVGCRAKGRSGADGAFEFDDVPEGAWWLHLVPHRSTIVAEGDSPSVGSKLRIRGELHLVAALPMKVDVAESASEVQVDLVVELDRAIRGRVRAADVGEFGGVTVVARPVSAPVDDEIDLARVFSEVAMDGSFLLAPLVDGEWELVADVGDTLPGYCEPPPLRVKAGATDVEIVLAKTGAALAGRVVDAGTLKPVDDAWCTIVRDEDSSVRAEGTRGGGCFSIRFPEGGTFTVRVTTRDGRFGMATKVVVASGATRDGIEIALVPGALLRLKSPADPSGCRFEVRRDGIVVAANSFGTRAQIDRTVPTGRLEVRYFRGDERIATHEVDAMSGATVSCGE